MFRKIRLSFNAENDLENQNFLIFCNFDSRRYEKIGKMDQLTKLQFECQI